MWKLAQRGLVAHSPAITHTQHRAHHMEKRGSTSEPSQALGVDASATCHHRGGVLLLSKPCPGSRPRGLASQSPRLDSPGPTGRMGTEASFLPMLCL